MKKSLLLIPIISLLLSCNKDTTPAWLEIQTIDLVTNEVVEGADSQQIFDAWLYMDGTPLGAFELPCRIPILAEGEHEFIIYAGIQVNGINDTRTRYPFYERYETTINLVKGETVIVNPTVYYKQNLYFALIEDFENVGISFVPEIESDTSIVFVNESLNPEIVKYGNSCGAIYLNEIDSLFKASTQGFYDLPKNNEDVYMEIDYMNTNSFAMGVIAQNSSDIVEHTPLVIFNAQESSTMVWKKLYIKLTDDVSYEINATSFEIYLLSVLDPENTAGVIYLDNIKLVHYQ